MSATCLLSNTAHDVRCPVCGQGFLLFAERISATARQQIRRDAESAVRRHHTHYTNHVDVHPMEPFTVGADDTALGHGLVPHAELELAGAAC